MRDAFYAMPMYGDCHDSYERTQETMRMYQDPD